MNQSQDQGELFFKDHLGLAHQHQEALLEALFEADPAALAVLIGPDLRYAFVNPAYRFLHPENGHALTGTRYADAGLHNNHIAFSEKLQTVYTTGAPYLQEKVDHSFTDGACRIFTLQARRFNWGGDYAVLLILWDTTELNNAQIALEESIRLEKQKTAQLEAFLEAAPALVWIAHDRESRVITGNTYSSEFLRMHPGDNLSKTAPEEQIPRHFRVLKEGQEIPPDQLPVQKAAASGEPVRDYDFDLVFEDGEVRHLFGNAAPLFDEAGQPCGAVSAFVDITDSKQAEEALAAAHRQNQNIIDNTPALVYALDLEERFILANRALAELLNVTKEQMIGKRRHEFMLKEDADWHEANDRQAIEAGKAIEFEEYSQLDDRSITWLTTKFPLRDAKGKIYAVGGISADVTERKRVENLAAQKTAEAHAAAKEAAIRAEKLEALLAEMRVITVERERAANEMQRRNSQIELQQRLLEQREQERMKIARDLHDGPMQEIMGSIYALQGMIATQADDNLNNGLRGVVASLQEQLTELRTYAQELRPPTLFQFGLEKALRSYLEPFQEKHPDIQVSLEAAQEGGLLPDDIRLALYRIFQEAMNNLAKHCRKVDVWVRFKKTADNAILEIADDGPGFEVPHDWLALARAGHLGLVGMRERAEAVGGTLAVDSKPGKGTTIRVEVPAPRIIQT